MHEALIADHWPEVVSAVAARLDLNQTAHDRGAFRQARGVPDAASLLRLALAWGARAVAAGNGGMGGGRRCRSLERPSGACPATMADFSSGSMIVGPIRPLFCSAWLFGVKMSRAEKLPAGRCAGMRGRSGRRRMPEPWKRPIASCRRHRCRPSLTPPVKCSVFTVFAGKSNSPSNAGKASFTLAISPPSPPRLARAWIHAKPIAGLSIEDQTVEVLDSLPLCAPLRTGRALRSGAS